jgi:hypothetical protein
MFKRFVDRQLTDKGPHLVPLSALCFVKKLQDELNLPKSQNLGFF